MLLQNVTLFPLVCRSCLFLESHLSWRYPVKVNLSLAQTTAVNFTEWFPPWIEILIYLKHISQNYFEFSLPSFQSWGRTYSVKPLSFSASLQKYQNIVRLTKVNLTASSSLRSTGAPNHTDCQSVVLHWMMDHTTNAIGACNNENWVGFILFRWGYLKKHLDHVVHSVLRLKSCKRNPGVFLLLRWLSCS